MGEKKGEGKQGMGSRKEQTGAQQRRVVARRPREQHDTEAGRVQAAVQRQIHPSKHSYPF